MAANVGESWNEGSYRIWTLRDGCELVQGESRVVGREGVLWVEAPQTPGAPYRVVAYIDGQVVIQSGGQTLPANTAKPREAGSLQPGDSQNVGWIGRLQSTNEPQITVAKQNPVTAENSPRGTPLYARAWQRSRRRKRRLHRRASKAIRAAE
ncbi:MAG: hypothetical protein QM811_22650 [Pirellulales bacterium]